VATTALDDLLGFDERAITKDRLYRCLDRLLPHKPALEQHLTQRYGALFGATFDVLLYDLTSTYFEGLATGVEKAQHGYSRDHRPDCKQVVLALVVNVEGFPVAYEVFAGNRRDTTTLLEMVEAVEARYGRARRVWVFDRGMVSEANLEALRRRHPPTPYLVATPRSALKTYERDLLLGDWYRVRADVEVKCLPSREGVESFVLCRSQRRQAISRSKCSSCAR
jgi:transposase